MTEWKDPNNSPHIQQGAQVSSFPFARSLTDDFPRKRYQRRKDELKTVVHWGQRKLLLSEIEFLLLANEPDTVVVYAGAAPGIHLKMLAEMFPEHHFVLVDKEQFSVDASPGVTLIHSVFSDNLARQLKKTHAKKPILFISDVRTNDRGLDDDDVMQSCVQADMEAQERWHRILRAKKSLLKFKLPYKFGQTSYLEGDMRLPVWGPVTTTECRLIVERGAGKRVYDHQQHEEQMFFFNTVARTSMYEHGVVGVGGLDHCYDCAAEVNILKEYVKRHTDRNINCKVKQLSDQISKTLSSHRNLTTPNRIQTSGRRILG